MANRASTCTLKVISPERWFSRQPERPSCHVRNPEGSGILGDSTALCAYAKTKIGPHIRSFTAPQIIRQAKKQGV